jgi:dihydroorotase
MRMRLALSYAKRFGIKIISHPEDADLADAGLMNEGYWSTALGLPGITRAAEETMIARDCILAEIENTGVHIAHVSTRGGAEIIRQAKRRGVAVTCETAPHYIYATDEWVSGYDTNTKVNPPLRSEDDRLAIIDALLDGTIDCIATDHAPHHIDDKNVEYTLAANGISGFETAFSICWTVLVKSGLMSPEALIAKMTSAPAAILNLDAGALAEGKPADIAIIDPGAEWTVDPSKFTSRGHNSPFGGKILSGSVRCTIAGGQIAWKDGRICG